ncbi:MAG: branched-chain amino acid transport system substrate-binding protein [Gaiellaceae bacterium]|nr:branched-chain amino acid transport system substrate-binding protein [Gaiellaceae bacterium]
MSINRIKLGALLCVVAAGIAVASTAGAASQSAPGVTPTSVTIAGTFPLTGPASLYKTIPAAEQAYYSWVNNHGQVHGRDINLTVVDDQYDPSQTVPAVKDLVENQHVFAIVGSLGTAPALATWAYLNQRKVPQALLATGDSYWGTCMASGAFKPQPYCQTPKPWTIGWQPDYPGEARLYAKYVFAHKANPQVGILYQNDAYGLNYRAAFRKVFASHSALSDIVDEESYNVGDSASTIGAHVAAIQAHGANTFVIFATPTPSIQALVAQHALGFSSALTLLNNVSANRIFLNAAESNGATPDGVVSSTYIKSYSVDPDQFGMPLAHDVIYATGDSTLEARLNAGDSNLIYGLAVAWTAVDALKHAGADPTRASFMKALRNLNENPSTNTNPFIYTGMKVFTDSLTTFPMQQLQLQKWDGTTHDWSVAGMGTVVKSGH